MVTEAYQESHWYHSEKNVGCTALAQIKTNSILGHYQNLNYRNLQVSTFSEPDIDVDTPLFSRRNLIKSNDIRIYLLHFEDQFREKNNLVDYIEICYPSKALNGMVTFSIILYYFTLFCRW